jgi:hypothetical protein
MRVRQWPCHGYCEVKNLKAIGRLTRLYAASFYAACLYVLLTYAAGFALGTLRVMIIEPRVGAVYAVVIEAPFILMAMWFSSRRALKKVQPSQRISSYLAVGGMAFVFLHLLEVLGGMFLRGQSITAYFTHYTTPEGLMFFALASVFALMPVMQFKGGVFFVNAPL